VIDLRASRQGRRKREEDDMHHGASQAGSICRLPLSVPEFPSSTFSNRHFAQLETIFNFHKTKAVRVF
jgi:hypothetical protein